MLEKILDRRNVEKALQSVLRNGGSAGVDGMQTDELRDFLNASYQTLRQSILDGTYKPQPVKEVTIPKTPGRPQEAGYPHCHRQITSAMYLPMAKPVLRPKLQQKQLWVPSKTERTSGCATSPIFIK